MNEFEVVLFLKVVLAFLAFILFFYYKLSFNSVKQKMPLQFFYAKWKAAPYRNLVGISIISLALGFLVEYIEFKYFQENFSIKIYSNLMQIIGIVGILYLFFMISIENIPFFKQLAKRR